MYALANNILTIISMLTSDTPKCSFVKIPRQLKKIGREISNNTRVDYTIIFDNNHTNFLGLFLLINIGVIVFAFFIINFFSIKISNIQGIIYSKLFNCIFKSNSNIINKDAFQVFKKNKLIDFLHKFI